jgi:hypothetical protein
MAANYWTDYPFVELGDTPGQEAPVREIEVGEWDRNKYAKIMVNGLHTEIKSGYVYTAPGRCGEVPCLEFPRKHIGLF